MAQEKLALLWFQEACLALILQLLQRHLKLKELITQLLQLAQPVHIVLVMPMSLFK